MNCGLLPQSQPHSSLIDLSFHILSHHNYCMQFSECALYLLYSTHCQKSHPTTYQPTSPRRHHSRSILVIKMKSLPSRELIGTKTRYHRQKSTLISSHRTKKLSNRVHRLSQFRSKHTKIFTVAQGCEPFLLQK